MKFRFDLEHVVQLSQPLKLQCDQGHISPNGDCATCCHPGVIRVTPGKLLDLLADDLGIELDSEVGRGGFQSFSIADIADTKEVLVPSCDFNQLKRELTQCLNAGLEEWFDPSDTIADISEDCRFDAAARALTVQELFAFYLNPTTEKVDFGEFDVLYDAVTNCVKNRTSGCFGQRSRNDVIEDIANEISELLSLVTQLAKKFEELEKPKREGSAQVG